MGKIVEVYVMNREVVTRLSYEGRPLAAGSTVHYCTVKELAKTETGRMFSEEDEKALQLVRAFAAEKEFKVRIIDVAYFRGKFKAMLRKVWTTPTIVVGRKRIVGVPKKEEFEELLKH
jgi:protein-disulfide isomerase